MEECWEAGSVQSVEFSDVTVLCGEARRGEAGHDSEILRRIVSRTVPPRSSHLEAPDFSQVSSRPHKYSATTDTKK